MQLTNLGLLGLFIGTFLAGSVVPFSSDVLYVAILAAFDQKVIACLILAIAGNTLGTITTYFIGRLAKLEWIEKHLKVSPEKLEASHQIVRKYGPFAGLIAWVPAIGKPLLITLGIYKTNAVTTSLMILLGITIRFSVWTLVLTVI